MIAYKVLGLNEHGGLCSSNLGLSERYRKNYRRNVKNHPRVAGTKLFVFGSMGSAYRFMDHSGRDSIWEVEVPDKVKKKSSIAKMVNDVNLSHYWNNEHYAIIEKSPPPGTLLVDWVRLIKPV